MGFLLALEGCLGREKGQSGRLVDSSLHVSRVAYRSAEHLTASADTDDSRAVGSEVLYRTRQILLAISLFRIEFNPAAGPFDHDELIFLTESVQGPGD